jgi:hypothetical protein
MPRRNVEEADQHKDICSVEFVQKNHADGKGEEGAQISEGAGDLHAIKSVCWKFLLVHVPPYIF